MVVLKKHYTLKIIKRKYRQLVLKSFSIKSESKGIYVFIKRVLGYGAIGFISSIFLLLFLLLSDYTIKLFVRFLLSKSNETLLYRFAEKLIFLNQNYGLKNIDYFTDVIGIGAGVLGVLLGLFYTAFLTIVATKYSNINSVITFQLLRQRTINRYLILLSAITSLAFFFQFILSLGYSPTIVSCFLFSILILITLTSFVHYGKFALIFLDPSALANDLLSQNYQSLEKLIKNKGHIKKLDQGATYVQKIVTNIEIVQIIVQAANNPQTFNTSSDIISKSLLDFSRYYNSLKHQIPSLKGWHLKKIKYKSWDNAKDIELKLLLTVGNSPMIEYVENYNSVEKKIIDTQFDIFKHTLKISKDIQPLVNQQILLKTIAAQSDTELFNYFFDKFEVLLIDTIKEESNQINLIFRLQLVELYALLLINYLVGFNDNLALFSLEFIKNLSKLVHQNQDIFNKVQFPYFIRIWIDKYQNQLLNEYIIEKRLITPLFYTEFELAGTIQAELKTFWKKIINTYYARISNISKKLKNEKYLVETLQLNISCLEIVKKVEFFLDGTQKKIDYLNILNFQKDVLFEFSEKDDIIKATKNFNDEVLFTIWDLGFSVYEVENPKMDFPDFYGTYYNVILEDIVNQLLRNKTPDKEIISKYLPKFFISNILYVEAIRKKYTETENLDFYASKLYPFIIDLFDVSAIAILVSKCTGEEYIIDIIFDFWNEKCDDQYNTELYYWKLAYPVYKYCKGTLLRLNSSSYTKEHNRSDKFKAYLIKNKIIKKSTLEHSGLSFVENYVTDTDDLYLKAVTHSISINDIDISGLDEIFLEFFLRTRISLKSLNIKESRYGEKLSRFMVRKDT